MTLDGMVKMAKADQYTDEGKQTIEDARRTYKIGDISQATGLQKQPDGSWAPPKETKYGKVTTNKEGKVGIQQKLGKGSKFEEFSNEKTASRALANLTAGYNTTERSKQDPHSDEARQQKQWNKEVDKIKKENKAERRAEHAAEFKKKDNTTGKDFKEGQRIPNAGAIGQTYRHRERQYLAAHKKEAEANPKNVTERRAVLADLVANARAQAQMFEAVNDMSEGEGNEWEINSHVAEELEKLSKEEKELQSKLDSLEKKNASASRESKRMEAYKKEGFSNLKKYDNQDAAEAEMWDYIRGTERTKADVDTIKLYKAPDGKYKWTDDPAKQKKLEGYGYEETQKSDWLKNQTKENKPEPKRESVSSRRMQKDLDGNFWSRPEDFKEDIASRGWDVEEMTNEYAVISNEAGSQYEVRFDDHSDDGDLTVRTFKPLMIDEDDEDTDDSAPLTGDTKIRVRK